MSKKKNKKSLSESEEEEFVFCKIIDNILVIRCFSKMFYVFKLIIILILKTKQRKYHHYHQLRKYQVILIQHIYQRLLH